MAARRQGCVLRGWLLGQRQETAALTLNQTQTQNLILRLILMLQISLSSSIIAISVSQRMRTSPAIHRLSFFSLNPRLHRCTHEQQLVRQYHMDNLNDSQ